MLYFHYFDDVAAPMLLDAAYFTARFSRFVAISFRCFRWATRGVRREEV